MNVELQQSAVAAVGQKASAAIASGVVTAGTGISTYLEWLPAITGFIGMSIGATVSLGLFYLAIKKNRLERKFLYQQISVLSEKEAERLERAARRKALGEPIRRSYDTLV